MGLAEKLLEESLAGHGKVSLDFLLRQMLSVKDLRRVAKDHGLTPKGYRVDAAPSKTLAPLLAESKDVKVTEDVCSLLAERWKSDSRSKKESSKPAANLAPMLKLREQELEQTQEQLARGLKNSHRQRERIQELDHELLIERGRVAALRAELDQAERARQQTQPAAPSTKELQHQVHQLSREILELEQADAQQRLLLAERAAQITRLEQRVKDVEALLPKTRLKKMKPMPDPAPEPPVQFRLPHFTAAFLKSLEGKERRAIESAYMAIFQFCVHGDSYPGLQVKQLDPAPVWSFRAALKLRVYFKRRPDGDVDIVALADRQEQATMLRRYRDL